MSTESAAPTTAGRSSPNPMDFNKLYRPSALNSFQFIAVTGLIMSAGAHLILHYFTSSIPPGFNWLYVCWTALYVAGTLRNYFGKPDAPHHHHHHDHDHDHDDDDHDHTH